MVTVEELRARVAADYARLGLPSWPDPHPDLVAPGDAEYSRVSDPARYRIVQQRARIWAGVLERVLDAGVEVLEATPPASDDARGFDRGVRLVPRRAGALVLLLLERDVAMDPGEPSLPVVSIAVTQPEVVVGIAPDCGCDACDSGSQDLLDVIDDAVAAVVGGPFVALCGDGWHAQWHPGGGSSGGSGSGSGPDHEAMMELCRRLYADPAAPLPTGAVAQVGRSWLD